MTTVGIDYWVSMKQPEVAMKTVEVIVVVVKDLGTMRYFLGIEVACSPKDSFIPFNVHI